MHRLAFPLSIAGLALAGFVLYPSTDTETDARPTAEATSYSIDAVHSGVHFSIRHMGVSTFVGRFNQFDGSFDLDWGSPSGSSMSITVDPSSVDTNNEKRDGHLRSNDFFSVKQFPEIVFTATNFEKTGPDTMDVAGDLTFLGVTNEVTARVKLVNEGETRQGYKMGLDATFTIKRTDFNNSTYVENGSLGDEVTLMVNLAGVRG